MPDYKQPIKPIPGSLKVVELFETVQGEGIYIGVPSVFFRTGMCNLECYGCDTKWDDWTETKVEACAEKILSFKSKHVVFTGGEPTLWQNELAQLMSFIDIHRGSDTPHTFTVETNGAVPIKNIYLLRRVNLWSFSPKVGTLGHDEKFSRQVVLDNLLQTCGSTQLKYVLDPNIPEHVQSVFDFQKQVDREGVDGIGRVPDDRVFFQPYDKGTFVNIYNRQRPFDENGEYNSDLRDLTKLVLEKSGSRFRVVPQLHKYITFR